MAAGRQSKFGVKGARQGKVTVWRGVPYAAAPRGAGRFQPPEPPPPWDGPRTATELGPSSISTEVPGLVLPSGAGVQPESEDCLYLNVWAPRSRAKGRPVLVWLHGGAFVFGSGSNFDGSWLATRGDTVVVTINYRLGPWGFLDLAAAGGAGYEAAVNVGLLDQVAALRWVQDNIEAFGGDPSRVTVIGQASGASCVGALLAMPAANGLFHRAVMQSGAADKVQSRWRSRAVVVRMLNGLGVDYRDVAQLQDLPVAALRAAAGTLMRDADDAELEGEPFLPVVDGTVLPGHPLAGLMAGASAAVPLLISTCQQEANLYLAISPEGFIKAKELRARAWFGDVAWERLTATYQKGATSTDRGRADLLTDLLFGLPAVRTAEAHHRGGGRSWMMRFDHTPGQVPFDQLGPCHGADLPFTWLDFTGPPEAAFPGLSSKADRVVAETLQDVILTFARTGDPGTAALPAWPSYQPGRRAVMSIKSRSSLDLDPAVERRRAWDGLPLFQTLNLRRASRSGAAAPAAPRTGRRAAAVAEPQARATSGPQTQPQTEPDDEAPLDNQPRPTPEPVPVEPERSLNEHEAQSEPQPQPQPEATWEPEPSPADSQPEATREPEPHLADSQPEATPEPEARSWPAGIGAEPEPASLVEPEPRKFIPPTLMEPEPFWPPGDKPAAEPPPPLLPEPDHWARPHLDSDPPPKE